MQWPESRKVVEAWKATSGDLGDTGPYSWVCVFFMLETVLVEVKCVRISGCCCFLPQSAGQEPGWYISEDFIIKTLALNWGASFVFSE